MFVNFTISLRVYTQVGSVRIVFINQVYFQDKAIEWGSTFDQTLVSFARSTGIDLVLSLNEDPIAECQKNDRYCMKMEGNSLTLSNA